MSRQVISQIVELKCDGCDKVVTYEQIGLEAHPETIQALESWITSVRELFVQGQWMKVVNTACSRECMTTADKKMMDKIMIQLAEVNTDDPNGPSDGIDLSKLRVN